MRAQLLPVEAANYDAHVLHRTERCWTETNCYVDVFVEILHSLGLDPLAACAFTLSTDFEGEQWAFFKPPPDDLRRLYGIEIGEMNVFRPLADHVVEQLVLGRLLTIEVDAYFLPDTEGVSYRRQHVKTTIAPQMIDTADQRLGYFHNAGYFELAGEDYVGALRVDAGPATLPPYVELVRLDRLVRDEGRLAAVAGELAREHLERRPEDNPVTRMAKRIDADLPHLVAAGLDDFHGYAFGTCRQCGSNAEIAADFLDWLSARGLGHPDGAAAAYRRLSAGAKALEFGLARAAAGRRFDPSATLDEMAGVWEEAAAALAVTRDG